VSIGKPISPEGLTANELLQKVEAWIESEMRVISPAVYASERAPDAPAPAR
jgi:1-acyl-sn-glycerol-3-phosphate acyltransferase